MSQLRERVRETYARIREEGERPVWITVVPEEQAIERAQELEAGDRGLPLWGVPFAVKDNIDVAGMATTAGCPNFAYVPERNAPVVDRLLAAGAMLIGKTNMDQFATGLVGTRSPYGACSSVFGSGYISGGSSSGSAVAVAKGLVAFALGTDTAGSGRVPAAFNNVVGLKPTRGLVSTVGVVPACRTLDCVAVFARDCGEARRVFGVMSDDAIAGSPRAVEVPLWHKFAQFRFGVPREAQLEFFGDAEAARLFGETVARMEAIGGVCVEIDYEPFREAAELLYAGPWVAERFAAVGEFVTARPESVDAVVRAIIVGGTRYSAVDAFRAMYQLAELRERAEAEWAWMDLLLLPTAGTIYTHAQVAADPVGLNTNLGYYTNFVNLLDLAAVAVPAGFRADGLPFGVQLIGRALADEALLGMGERFAAEEERIEVAVVGAHLAGQPLHHQLTSRRARLVRACKTARDYRLYALKDSIPPKPGLVREPGFVGPGIEVEVWAVPAALFGSFVAGVPAPLGIGSCVLEDGAVVKSFICEGWGVVGAREITEFGGWRGFRGS